MNKKYMNIVFFGSSEFAVPSLKALLTTGHMISCIITQPDRKKDRGLSLKATPIKTIALEKGIKIYQPEYINTSETENFLSNLEADLFIVIAYGQILSPGILAIPKIFSINAHASLLPKYRGAAPINWAIINGDKVTAVTIIKMTEEMDAGPVIMQKRIDIDDSDTSITLENKLSHLAAELIIESLKSIENANYKLISQTKAGVSFAPKLKKEDGLIDWRKSAQDIRNLIRGCLSWPGAFTYYQGKLLKIYKARVSSQVCKFAGSNPGEILEVSREGIFVFTGEGNIIIEELQIEGKRRTRVKEFIAGHKILPGEILGEGIRK